LTDVARKHYFDPNTQGRCSIKKVLLVMMQSAAFLKTTYYQPVYGAPGGLPSQNFNNMVSWQ